MNATTHTDSNQSGHRTTSRVLKHGLALAALTLAIGVAQADPIAVPNGDFSDPANAGTIGGGLIGGSGTNVNIGAGPWQGTYWGLLALLAPPSLTIDSTSQVGRISGLAAASLVGIVNNGGYFTQTLGQNWETGRFYILSADVDAAELLTLTLLGSSGVSIGLRSGGTVVASSATAPAYLLDLDLLTGTNSQLRFGYFAEATATGPINLKLAYEPSGIANANLLTAVEFSNVELEVRDIGPPEDIEVLTFGGDLQAEINQPFTGDLMVKVRDAEGDGVPGHTVTFTAPTTGPSATLASPTGGTGTTVTAVTDIDGIAWVSAQANGEGGCYRVTAESADFPDIETFHLRNIDNSPGANSIFCNGYQ